MKRKDSNKDKLFVGLFMLASIAMVFFAAMSHGMVDKSAIILATLFALAVAFVIGGLYVILSWLQHKKLVNNPPFAEVQAKRGGGIVAAILTLFVTFAVSKLVFKLFEYLVISYVYGQNAWLHGLRIKDYVEKKPVLTNGDVLIGWPSLILNFGTFAVTAVFFFCSFLLFRYIGFRLRGRRW